MLTAAKTSFHHIFNHFPLSSHLHQRQAHVAPLTPNSAVTPVSPQPPLLWSFAAQVNFWKGECIYLVSLFHSDDTCPHCSNQTTQDYKWLLLLGFFSYSSDFPFSVSFVGPTFSIQTSNFKVLSPIGWPDLASK